MWLQCTLHCNVGCFQEGDPGLFHTPSEGAAEGSRCRHQAIHQVHTISQCLAITALAKDCPGMSH